MANAREIALLVLYEIEYNGAYSNMALKNCFFKNDDISPADKGFITRLVYGVVSKKLNLEYIISQNSKIKLKKISKYILLILKMGIYQLKYMDKIPQSAAVNESVKLAKRYGHQSSAGFVNGLLRSVTRNEIKYPPNDILSLAYEYSYPEELVKKWCNDFGIEFAKELMIAMNEAPEVSLRVNTLKADVDEIVKNYPELLKSELYENALIAKGFDVGGSELYKSGKIIAQDIAAMLSSLVLAPKKGDKVLDICAAPGGKTTHIAELMENDGEILACDIHEHKVELIDKNAERMGIDIITTVCMDSSKHNDRLNMRFDKVLADVPCSGYGIIRRKPDIKWKSEENEELIKTATQILLNAMQYVKVGGELVFSTCTVNREENELRLEKVLSENKNFEIVDITEFLPKPLRHDSAKKGYVTFYPNVDCIDGFFIAKIKRCS